MWKSHLLSWTFCKHSYFPGLWNCTWLFEYFLPHSQCVLCVCSSVHNTYIHTYTHRQIDTQTYTYRHTDTHTKWEDEVFLGLRDFSGIWRFQYLNPDSFRQTEMVNYHREDGLGQKVKADGQVWKTPWAILVMVLCPCPAVKTCWLVLTHHPSLINLLPAFLGELWSNSTIPLIIIVVTRSVDVRVYTWCLCQYMP